METRDEVLDAIREHLEGRGIDQARVIPEAELVRDLDLDSLDTMELTLSMEERFAIEIPDEDLEALTTVRDAVELIQSRLPVGA